MSAPSTNSPSQAEREAAGRTGMLPGKVHVLPGVRIVGDDAAAPIVSPTSPHVAPSGLDVARVALGAGACAALLGGVAVAAAYGPVPALCVAVPFAVPVAIEAWAWWRGRRS